MPRLRPARMETHMPDGPDNSASQTAPSTGEPGSAQQQAFDWDNPENPWKRNFEEYRREADRRATQLSTYESLLEDLRSPDLERQRAAARELGVDLVEDEPVYDDPVEAVAAELAETRRQLAALAEKDAQRDAERERKEKEAQLSQRIDSALNDLGLDEADGDWVLARAVALGADDSGLPKLREAYEQLRARDEAAMQRWASTKGRARSSIAPGSTGTETKDVAEMSDTERIDWALARLEDRA